MKPENHFEFCEFQVGLLSEERSGLCIVSMWQQTTPSVAVAPNYFIITSAYLQITERRSGYEGGGGDCAARDHRRAVQYGPRGSRVRLNRHKTTTLKGQGAKPICILVIAASEHHRKWHRGRKILCLVGEDWWRFLYPPLSWNYNLLASIWNLRALWGNAIPLHVAFGIV